MLDDRDGIYRMPPLKQGRLRMAELLVLSANDLNILFGYFPCECAIVSS